MEYSINDELLIRYLTETLTDEENVQVEQWCALSDENRKVLEQLYFTLETSNRLKVFQSVDPDNALLRLKDRIRQQENLKRRRTIFMYMQRVAAVLFLPVLLLWGGSLLYNSKMPAQYVELHSNPGMVMSFDLPDGSKVWLNGKSSLRYPTKFKGKNREVQMSGQGYFEIQHNPQRPFSVKVGETFSLEVLGTSFNLSAYDDEDIIETTLVTGSLRLNLLQNGKMVQCMMKPNEKVIYTKNKESVSTKIITGLLPNDSTGLSANENPGSVKIATVDPKYEIAWKDNRILFKNHPMEQVIRTLERYYNVKFAVKDKKIWNSQITGTFSNEQLQQVMEYLKIASDIKYNIIPATVINGEKKPEMVEIWK